MMLFITNYQTDFDFIEVAVIFAGAELTSDADANVPQRELDRKPEYEQNISIRQKLEVKLDLFRGVSALVYPFQGPHTTSPKSGYFLHFHYA